MLAQRDSLLAALRAFEALGDRPQVYILFWIRNINIALNQWPASGAFLRGGWRTTSGAKPGECRLLLPHPARLYRWQRDYNQGISMGM